jgi:hypothetical protein
MFLKYFSIYYDLEVARLCVLLVVTILVAIVVVRSRLDLVNARGKCINTRIHGVDTARQGENERLQLIKSFVDMCQERAFGC